MATTAAARLRRTFHYPSDDDDGSPSSTPELLDEQEQETLITNLTTENRQRNASFLRLLTILPALSSIPFLLGIFFPPTSSRVHSSHTILCLLGLSSLLATGWLLFRLDVTETGFSFLDRGRTTTTNTNLSRPTGSDSEPRFRLGRGGYSYIPDTTPSQRQTQRQTRSTGILGNPLQNASAKSPLERHLPHLNLTLAILSLLTGVLERLKLGPDQPGAIGVNPLLLGALPGAVYASVIGAKVVMAGVDPERELSGLKYAYKGA